jgi:hypothetical protein
MPMIVIDPDKNKSDYAKSLLVEMGYLGCTNESQWKRTSRRDTVPNVILRKFEYKPTGQRVWGILSTKEETIGDRFQIWDDCDTLFGIHETGEGVFVRFVSRTYYETYKKIPEWHCTETIEALYSINNLDEVSENYFYFAGNRDSVKANLASYGLIYNDLLNSSEDIGDEPDANSFL